MSRLFAAVYDPFMRKSERACLSEWRRELLSALEGRVLEIGAGTGANVPHWPATLERLVLTDPDEHMMKRLRRRLDEDSPVLRASPEVLVANADALPFGDASFDAIVSTLVLCSVPDQATTLAELRRVLRPGGTLVFLEHVASDDEGRLRWQRRLEPLWSRIAGNCHLTRRTAEAISSAGFTIEVLVKESMRKALPVVRPTIRGRARRD